MEHRNYWAASTSYEVKFSKDTSTNIFIALTAHTSSGSQPLTTNTDSANGLIVDVLQLQRKQPMLLAQLQLLPSSATTATTKHLKPAHLHLMQKLSDGCCSSAISFIVCIYCNDKSIRGKPVNNNAFICNCTAASASAWSANLK